MKVKIRRHLSFKSHHEGLDDWAMKELIGAHVAYRKLVSPKPSDLLPADQFGLYAVAARFPQDLSQQVPWQEVHDGVYDCRWGTDTIRVVVAGKLPREPHNAPLHLFSATPELIAFGSSAYRRRSEATSLLLGQLFARLRTEDFTMSYTMEDFKRDYVKEHFAQLTPEERREALEALPPEELLGALSTEQIQQYLNQLTASRPAGAGKARRKR